MALALVPKAVAFAFVAGIDPLVSLYGAFMMEEVKVLKVDFQDFKPNYSASFIPFRDTGV